MSVCACSRYAERRQAGTSNCRTSSRPDWSIFRRYSTPSCSSNWSHWLHSTFDASDVNRRCSMAGLSAWRSFHPRIGPKSGSFCCKSAIWLSSYTTPLSCFTGVSSSDLLAAKSTDKSIKLPHSPSVPAPAPAPTAVLPSPEDGRQI